MLKKLYTLQKIQNRVFYLIDEAPIKGLILSVSLSAEVITYHQATMVREVYVENSDLKIRNAKNRRSENTQTMALGLKEEFFVRQC